MTMLSSSSDTNITIVLGERPHLGTFVMVVCGLARIHLDGLCVIMDIIFE